jgi:fluoride ion exporter CrcB/FEX
VSIAVGFVVLAAAGALVRTEVAVRANRPGRLPWGTLAANLGATAGLALVARSAPEWLTVAGVGGIGALSTFSTFAGELSEILERRPLSAVAYLCATLGGAVGIVLLLS